MFGAIDATTAVLVTPHIDTPSSINSSWHQSEIRQISTFCRLSRCRRKNDETVELEFIVNMKAVTIFCSVVSLALATDRCSMRLARHLAESVCASALRIQSGLAAHHVTTLIDALVENQTLIDPIKKHVGSFHARLFSYVFIHIVVPRI